MTPAVATLMFERNTVLGSIGYYDCVRFGADSEYLERIKVTFGSDRVRHFDLPLRLATSSKKSLTGKADTGIDHIMGTSKIRLEYKASWTKWHKQSDKLYIPYNFTAERKFFAPSKMLPF
jgi:hypothetical protein